MKKLILYIAVISAIFASAAAQADDFVAKATKVTVKAQYIFDNVDANGNDNYVLANDNLPLSAPSQPVSVSLTNNGDGTGDLTGTTDLAYTLTTGSLKGDTVAVHLDIAAACLVTSPKGGKINFAGDGTVDGTITITDTTGTLVDTLTLTAVPCDIKAPMTYDSANAVLKGGKLTMTVYPAIIASDSYGNIQMTQFLLQANDKKGLTSTLPLTVPAP